MSNITVDSVLNFWFSDTGVDRVKVWFRKDSAFDTQISEQFGAAIDQARKGAFDHWADDAQAGEISQARGALALVVLCDQLSRNAHRDHALAFAGDEKALSVVERTSERGLDKKLSFLQRYVFSMPLMHAESRGTQARSVAAFAALVQEAVAAGESERVIEVLRSASDYAVKHANIVERFGRYPHRNAILGRDSSAEERAFLAQPGLSF